MPSSSDLQKLLIASNRTRKRLIEPSFCGGWTINPYPLCDRYCTYCVTRVAGPSNPVMPIDAMKSVLHSTLPDIPRRTPISFGGIADAYPRVEARLGITRALLPLVLDTGNPVRIVTKGTAVTRDADLLVEHPDVNVAISIGVLDESAARRIEPFAPTPDERIAAVRTLEEAGVSVSVICGPWVPGLTDLRALLAQLDDETLVLVQPLQVHSCGFDMRRFCSLGSQAEIDDAYMAEFESIGTPDNVRWLHPPTRRGDHVLQAMAAGRLYKKRFASMR